MLTARQGSRQITLVNRGGLTESATHGSARWLTMRTNRVAGLGVRRRDASAVIVTFRSVPTTVGAAVKSDAPTSFGRTVPAFPADIPASRYPESQPAGRLVGCWP
jgi:hypothetical protein